MQRIDIEKDLLMIFRDIFQDDSLELLPNTTAKDVAGWDSLNHINLVLAVERHFKVRFTVKEISKLANVGSLTDLIVRRVGAT
jgi:acyl carrier protein